MAGTDPDSQNCSESDGEDSFPTLSSEQSTEAIGTRIGRYKLLSVLGEGGFGIVYLAEQERPLKRRVALKVIKPGMDTRQVIARFEAERQALALLDHPNIARVFDAGTTDAGRPYFVMELIQGVSIVDYCDRHKLSIKQRLELFIEVCEAVQYGHQKGIIHRDLKPSNIMVSAREGKAVPIVIDFGVAKAMSQSLTERTLFTEQGQFIGTPEYMSPEQAEMTAEQIDTRSDIYSLGVVLYELLTGTLPFEGQTLREGGITSIRKIIRHEVPKTPSTRLSGLGDEARRMAECRRTDVKTLIGSLKRELEWIPLKAMRKEPDRRYRTVSDLGDDIQDYLQGNPLEAGPESIVYRVRKLVHKHAVAVGTVMAFLLLLVTALIVSVTLYSRAERDRTKAVTAAQSARKAEEEARKAQNNAERAAYALRISQAARDLETLDIHPASVLLTQCPNALRGLEWDFMWQRVRALGSPLPIFPTGRYQAPVISADGRRILADSIAAVSAAFGTSQTDVTVWDVNTASRITTLRWHDYHEALGLRAGIISANGERVALAGRHGAASGSANSSEGVNTKISVWNATSGVFMATFLERGKDVSLAFSPEGQRIVSDSGPKGLMRLWDANTGDMIRTVADSNDSPLMLAYSPDGSKILRLGKRGELTVWSEQGTCLFALPDDVSRGYYHAAWHPDSHRIACVDSNSITIYDIESDSEPPRIPAGPFVQAVAFSGDGHLIAWADKTGMVAVTSLKVGQMVFENREADHLCLGRFRGLIDSLAFTQDGNHVVTVGAGEVHLWNVHPADQAREIIGFTPPEGPYLLSLTRDGEHIVTTTSRDQIRVHRVGQKEPVCILDANMPYYDYAPSQVSHDGRYLARFDPTDEDWTTVMLRVWDVSTGDVIFSRTRKGFVEEEIFALGPDGRFIAFVESKAPRDVVVYDVLKNAKIGTYPAKEFGWYGVSAIALSPDARYLAVKTGQRVYLTDTKSREPHVLEYSPSAIRFSPNGEYLLIDADETMTVVETDSAQKIFSCSFMESSKCVDLSMSLGGEHCSLLRVPENNERSIELWDVASAMRIFALGTAADVNDVAFTEDGRGVMAVCDDGKVRMWDMGQGDDIRAQATDWYACGVALFQDRRHEWAISALSDCINLDPLRPDAYRFRGAAYSVLAGWKHVIQKYADLAVADLTKALELETDNARKRDILGDLGFLCSHAHRYEEAIVYFEAYLSQIRNNPGVYAADLGDVSRELIPAYARTKQHEKAQATYSEMLRGIARFPEDTVSSESRVFRFMPFFRGKTLREPLRAWCKTPIDFYQESHDPVHEKEMLLVLLESDCFDLLSPPEKNIHMNRLARTCATSPDPQVRDGQLAVEYAKTCELTEWNDAAYIDTLAAAYAEVGDFAKAIEMQKKAIELLGDEDDSSGYMERLILYQKGQPYREGP